MKEGAGMEVARVTSSGQITIPIDIRRRLNIKEGDKVMFMESGEGFLMLNSSIAAFKQFQKEMEGEAEKAGLFSEDDVVALCREVRTELSEKRNANNG